MVTYANVWLSSKAWSHTTTHAGCCYFVQQRWCPDNSWLHIVNHMNQGCAWFLAVTIYARYNVACMLCWHYNWRTTYAVLYIFVWLCQPPVPDPPTVDRVNREQQLHDQSSIVDSIWCALLTCLNDETLYDTLLCVMYWQATNTYQLHNTDRCWI